MAVKVLSLMTFGSALGFVILSLVLVFGWRRIGETDPDPRLLTEFLEQARSMTGLVPAADSIERNADALRKTEDAQKHRELRSKLLAEISGLVVIARVHASDTALESRTRDTGLETPAKPPIKTSDTFIEKLDVSAKKITFSSWRYGLVISDLILAGISILLSTAILVASSLPSDV